MIVTKDQAVPVKESLEESLKVVEAQLAARLSLVQAPSVSETVLILLVSPDIRTVIHKRGH